MEIKRLGNSKISLLRFNHNKILKKTIPTLEGVKTILDAGGSQSQVDGQGELYKNYFPFAEYFTLDSNRGESKNNHFNMNLHDLSSLNKKFDLVLCTSVLEHVKNPFVVARQLENISNKYLFIVVPFMFPFHPKGPVKDYWRFTDDGLRELFINSEEIWIKKIDSVIRVVKDRKAIKNKEYKGWNKNNSATGFVALFRKK
jgi:hypothetical protein